MTSLTILVTTCHTSIVTMPRKRAVMTDNERAELPSSLFILSGTNCFRRAAVWLVRWIVFEWIIILTIIGKQKFIQLGICLQHFVLFGTLELATLILAFLLTKLTYHLWLKCTLCRL